MDGRLESSHFVCAFLPCLPNEGTWSSLIFGAVLPRPQQPPKLWPGSAAKLSLPKHFHSGCRTRRKAHSNEIAQKQRKSIRACRSLSDYSFYEHPPSAPTQGTKGLKPDDTPKSFLRLVNRKPRKELIAEGKIQVEKKNKLKIEPGESLHEFKRFTCCLTTDLQGRRVDQEIPVKMGGMNMKERRPKKRKPQATADEDEEPAEKKKRYECSIMFMLTVDDEERRRRNGGVYRQIHTVTL
jgi:hypothetical protein